MTTIELKGLDKNVYKETLDNGLEIYMVPYENKVGYSMHYVTRFGSKDTSFIPVGKDKMIKVQDGIAHFLEHKLFESEDGEDPFSFAAKTGTECNASTSYNSTRYLFEGNQGFYENLEYLLNYVNSPYFTDENVEKEKGIIEEEILQYKDIIEFVMEILIKEGVYKEDPIRVDIGGTVESIRKITKEELYDTYNTFYQPSNMFLVITGNFDVDKCLDVIKNNKKLKEKQTNKEIVLQKYDEPLSINKEYTKIKFNVQNTKVSYTLKVSLKNIENRYEYVTYYGMMLSALFGLSSSFREKARKEDLMTSFNYTREYSDDYMTISFMAVSDKPEELIENIKEELKNMEITEEDVNRIKKVWISSEIMMIDDMHVTLDNIVYDLIEFKDIIANKIDFYRSMNLDKLLEYVKDLDYNNGSVVIIEPK